jgi:D-alanyl-D-alanine carboxypeptidase
MKPNTFGFSIMSILILGLTACSAPTEKALDRQLASKLQTALQEAVKNPDSRFPGALLYVSSPGIGTWAGAAGLSDVEATTAMRPDDEFRAASILKPFVAVVILQLVEEGQFSLDDPMTVVLPESVTSRFPDSDRITLRMLLNHTSGIPDWLTETMMGEIFANPRRVWDVHEYLDVAAAQEPYFPPGEGWRYSNTDYNLLSLVIEQATEGSWREEVRARVVTPLNLESTRLPEPGDLSISDNHAHGYIDMDGNLIDFTEIDPSMAGAAGGHALITTTADLARFLNAVLAGELFQNTATLDEMLVFVEVPEGAGVSRYPASYGLGMMRFLLPGNVEMLGHPGSTGGFESFAYYLPAQHLTISGMMSSTGADGSRILIPTMELLVPEFASDRQ